MHIATDELMMDQQEQPIMHLLDYQGNVTSSELLEEVSMGTYAPPDSVTSFHASPLNIVVTSEQNDDSNTMMSDLNGTIQSVTSDNVSDNNQSEEATNSSKEDEPKKKKKRNRTKNPDPPPEAVLPPCKICNEKSSGYHYGVNSCEACKGFFRRTQKKKEVKFKCKCRPEDKGKWKLGPYKNGCAACRYERCLHMGMSKNAIKIGRYTICHKNNNISEANEVKTLQSPKPPPSETSRSGFVPEHDTFTADGIFDLVVTHALNDSPPSSEYGSEMSELTSNASMSDLTDLVDSPSSLMTILSDGSGQANDSPGIHSKAKRRRVAHYAFNYENAGITLKQVDTIVKTVTEAHKMTIFEDNTTYKEIKKQQTEYLEKLKMEKQLFGEMKVLTEEEFLEFYKATGIDIDGRLEEVERGLSYYEKRVSSMVAFGKAIPGFKQLCLDDQASLIKSSRLDNVLMAGYKQLCRNIDWDRKILVSPWGDKLSFEENVPSVEYLLAKTRFAEKIQSLDLSIQEESMLRAILILASDHGDLRDQGRVLEMQQQMIFCLRHLLNVRHDGPGTKFYKIISLITDLRSLLDFEVKFVNEVMKRTVVSEAIKNYALVREFLS